MLVWLQIKQGAHASKFQQNDWRAGRKGGVGADVSIAANPDARNSAFTDVRVASSADNASTAAPPAAADTAAAISTADAAPAGRVAPVATNGNSSGNNNKTNAGKAAVAESAVAAAKENKVENINAWSKEQEMALIKALKAVSKDVSDRCLPHSLFCSAR